MAKKSDFEIGQKVWHTAIPSRKVSLFEGEVTKVGNKYVTVNNRYRFFIETLLEDTNYGAKGRLYLDKQDYEDAVELGNNLLILRKSFDFNCGLTLEQTRQILKIINRK